MDIIACGSRPSRRWAGAELHRHGVAGSDHPGARSRAAARRLGAVRAGRAHVLAYAIRSGRRCTSSPASAMCRLGAVRSGEIRAGDTVWIPPDEKHWHGATPDHGMEHIAMQEAQGGEHVKWLEAVTDAQYQGKPG